MKNNYDFCIKEVLKSEGGYTNDPSDNGGATNFGITITDYRKYINKNGTPTDVKNMSVTQAKNIYKAKYWNALGCDDLPAGVDYTCFDYGVNSGLGRPKKDLVKFKTLTGDKLIDAINDERMTFLRSIGTGHNAKYLSGWTARVARVRKDSHKLAQDNLSGPAAGTAAGLGLWATLHTYITAHPYLSVAAAVAAGTAIWAGVHYIRNKK